MWRRVERRVEKYRRDHDTDVAQLSTESMLKPFPPLIESYKILHCAILPAPRLPHKQYPDVSFESKAKLHHPSVRVFGQHYHTHWISLRHYTVTGTGHVLVAVRSSVLGEAPDPDAASEEAAGDGGRGEEAMVPSRRTSLSRARFEGGAEAAVL